MSVKITPEMVAQSKLPGTYLLDGYLETLREIRRDMEKRNELENLIREVLNNPKVTRDSDV